MTDREILAQLKKSYENLQDIRENGCNDHCTGQLENNHIQQLEVAMKKLSNIYSDFYDSLDNDAIIIKSSNFIDGIIQKTKRNGAILSDRDHRNILEQTHNMFNNIYQLRIDKDIRGYYELINNDGTSDYVGLDVLCNYEWYDDINYLNENLEKEEDYEIL